MAGWRALKDRLAHKWQVPLLAVALAALAVTVFRNRPAPEHYRLERAVAYLEVYVPGGLYDQAIALAQAQLPLEGRTDRERAPLHLYLARAMYGKAVRDRRRDADWGRQIVEHFGAAVDHGQALSAKDLALLGYAHEWQRHYAIAVDYHRQAVVAGLPGAADLRRHILLLERDKLGIPSAQLRESLTAFLEQVPEHRLDLRIWGIEQQLRVLDEFEACATLLAENRDRFAASTFRDRFAYLDAVLLFRTGYAEEAERQLRTIRNRVDQSDEVYAMSGWLLGRAVLGRDEPQRPEEAISFFRDVIGLYPDHPYGIASRVGLADALTVLNRTDEAIEAYELALAGLRGRADPYPVDIDALRTSLGVNAAALQREGRLRAAVEYARMATGLVDRADVELYTLYLEQLADTRFRYAADLEHLDDQSPLAAADTPMTLRTEAARAQARMAAEDYLRIARINTLDERRASRTSWLAASLFRQSGDWDRAVALFEVFVRERPNDTRVPRAWYQIGTLYRDLRRLDEAVGAFQECYKRFPRTLDGARALIPLAETYVEQGPAHYDLAVKTLRLVLDDPEVFTPRAPEFADALFLLGDVLNRQGEVESAVTTLREALDRYPDDPRSPRARFLLADSYRRSALGLKADALQATIPREVRYMRREADERFGRAHKLYRALMDEYGRRDAATLDPRERLYLRLAQLYEADCFFEMRQYRQALKLYEEAAGAYPDKPSALAAYLQIINCHALLNEPQEARATLARALVLVDAMPQRSFDDSISPETRRSWRRFLIWLGQSDRF